MDHATNGDLFNYICKSRSLPGNLTYTMHGVLLALAHLQHHRIVHPGVKPANLFSMLADFGISIPADGSASIPRCGAPLGCVGLSDRFLQDVAMPMQHFGDKVRVSLDDPTPESLMLFLGSMVCRCRKQLWRNI